MPSSGELPELSQAVAGGTVDIGVSGAVAIVDSDGAFRCSGCLVAPRLVLSAGHCLVAGESPLLISTAHDAEAPFERVDEMEIHPEFEATALYVSSFMHDLALLFLAQASSARPMVLGAEPPELNAIVKVVAYGRTEPTTADQGVRRSGNSIVTSVDREGFSVQPAPAQPCLFDSGGPVLSESAQVLGVVSTGDRECSSSAHVTRVDAEWEWIGQGIARSESEHSELKLMPTRAAGCSSSATPQLPTSQWWIVLGFFALLTGVRSAAGAGAGPAQATGLPPMLLTRCRLRSRLRDNQGSQ